MNLSQINKKAWSIRKAASARYGCPVMEIVWGECFRIAKEVKVEIRIETSSYNDRRYGRPWIAKVDFATNPKGNFLWGDWIGSNGDNGLLVIKAEAGDIIARGQKDNRKPRNSAPDYYVVMADGKLCVLNGKAEAYKHYMGSHK